MKKFILAFLICLSVIEAKAANLTDTLGAECSRILFNMENTTYPNHYDAIKKRNNQLAAFNLCILTYKDNLGDIELLNQRYYRAKEIYDIYSIDCLKKDNEEKQTACYEAAAILFSNDLKRDIYEIYAYYKNLAENEPYTQVLELIKMWLTEDEKAKLDKILK